MGRAAELANVSVEEYTDISAQRKASIPYAGDDLKK
jgi:predicted HTH domain antitoxin